MLALKMNAIAVYSWPGYEFQSHSMRLNIKQSPLVNNLITCEVLSIIIRSYVTAFAKGSSN